MWKQQQQQSAPLCNDLFVTARLRQCNHYDDEGRARFAEIGCRPKGERRSIHRRGAASRDRRATERAHIYRIERRARDSYPRAQRNSPEGRQAIGRAPPPPATHILRNRRGSADGSDAGCHNNTRRIHALYPDTICPVSCSHEKAIAPRRRATDGRACAEFHSRARNERILVVPSIICPAQLCRDGPKRQKSEKKEPTPRRVRQFTDSGDSTLCAVQKSMTLKCLLSQGLRLPCDICSRCSIHTSSTFVKTRKYFWFNTCIYLKTHKLHISIYILTKN